MDGNAVLIMATAKGSRDTTDDNKLAFIGSRDTCLAAFHADNAAHDLMNNKMPHGRRDISRESFGFFFPLLLHIVDAINDWCAGNSHRASA